jgi:hypothetical protein
MSGDVVAARRAQARFSLVAKRCPQLLLGEFHYIKKKMKSLTVDDMNLLISKMKKEV